MCRNCKNCGKINIQKAKEIGVSVGQNAYMKVNHIRYNLKTLQSQIRTHKIIIADC